MWNNVSKSTLLRILASIAVVCLLMSLSLYAVTHYEVVRWQQKAILDYEVNLKAYEEWKTPDKPNLSKWLQEDPTMIAFNVWLSMLSNIITMIVCLTSGIGAARAWRSQNLQQRRLSNV